MNNIALSVALATTPSSAFEELRQRPRFWFPLLLVVLTSAAVWYWYYSIVDFEWFKDAIFSKSPDMQALPAEQREAALALYSRNMMLWGTVVGVSLTIPIMFLIFALYMLLAAKVTKLSRELRFKHWFALAAWAALPLVLGNVVSAIMLLLADTPQLNPGTMAPLTINELLLHRPFGGAGQMLNDSLSIPTLLSWVLMIIGVRAWSQRSWVFSTLFVLLPAVVVYGTWAFFVFS